MPLPRGATDALAPDADGAADALAPSPFTVSFDPISVAAGIEDTQCVVKRLGNPGPIHVGSIHDVLPGAASYVTLIVYAVPDTTEQPTPFDCQPFTMLSGGPAVATPIAISRSKDDTFTYPAGVGVTLTANQMVRLELHYANSTNAPIQVGASSTLMSVPDASFQEEAGLLVVIFPDVAIPAEAEFTLHEFFTLPAALAGAQTFAVSGLENELGTGIVAKVGTSAIDSMMTTIYDPAAFSWSSPSTVYAAPPLAVPTGGGFDVTCTWNNTTPASVAFGESAGDEICDLVVHYVPNQGASACVHTDKNGGADVCCPGDGGLAGTVCASLGQ